jgi:hypothetical protein
VLSVREQPDQSRRGLCCDFAKLAPRRRPEDCSRLVVWISAEERSFLRRHNSLRAAPSPQEKACRSWEIPAIFDRGEDFGVVNKPHKGCKWVFAGEGRATERVDGSNIRLTVRSGQLVRLEKRTAGLHAPCRGNVHAAPSRRRDQGPLARERRYERAPGQARHTLAKRARSRMASSSMIPSPAIQDDGRSLAGKADGVCDAPARTPEVQKADVHAVPAPREVAQPEGAWRILRARRRNPR